jgi:hypothetical protein
MINHFNIKQAQTKYHNNGTQKSKTGDSVFEFVFESYIHKCEQPLKNYNRHCLLPIRKYSVFERITNDKTAVQCEEENTQKV